jgi:nucleoside 2-deoxyribosyltransferase
MSKRVYLAGPDVFLSNACEIGASKRAICARYGLIGVFPADEVDATDATLPPVEQGLAISRAMESIMRTCDAMIVNLTPFRGPSADVGLLQRRSAIPGSCRRFLRRHAHASHGGTGGSRWHGD